MSASGSSWCNWRSASSAPMASSRFLVSSSLFIVSHAASRKKGSERFTATVVNRSDPFSIPVLTAIGQLVRPSAVLFAIEIMFMAVVAILLFLCAISFGVSHTGKWSPELGVEATVFQAELMLASFVLIGAMVFGISKFNATRRLTRIAGYKGSWNFGESETPIPLISPKEPNSTGDLRTAYLVPVNCMNCKMNLPKVSGRALGLSKGLGQG